MDIIYGLMQLVFYGLWLWTVFGQSKKNRDFDKRINEIRFSPLIQGMRRKGDER